MKQDRALLGILAMIALLIIVSLTLFFTRGGNQEYVTDDTPEGVVRNYVLALHKEDYERAYGYLQDEDGKPSFSEFRAEFVESTSNIKNTGLQIDSTEQTGDDATVRLTIIRGGTEPFERAWNESNDAWLTLQKGGWKITYFPHPYWGWDWYTE
ncbi:MAG: hypothetical protein U9Q82_14425 [Chloroflexota bacterium]|nr:hypothetical protein [Chloroflexota bacterium]